MQIVLLLIFLSSCSSFVDLDKSHANDPHRSIKISYHQMGLEFQSQSRSLGEDNEIKLNSLSQQAISTSQPIKKISIFSNPNNKDQLPKEELLNHDRAVNAKRFIERDLHSPSKIEITSEKPSPYKYPLDADILILIEYI